MRACKINAGRSRASRPEDSPQQRVIIELDCDHRPELVFLSASTRSALNKALDYEETTILAEIRGLAVVIDVDGPL